MQSRIAGNPRLVPDLNHRERGPKRYSYTAQEVADASGVSIHTLYAYQHRGQLDIGRLASVAGFIAKRRLIAIVETLDFGAAIVRRKDVTR